MVGDEKEIDISLWFILWFFVVLFNIIILDVIEWVGICIENFNEFVNVFIVFIN